MILEKQKQSKVLQTGQNNESIGMSLDLDSAQVLMQMLSKNLYSDSIGSAVRECASNALDSHRRAGVTKPIIVSLVRNDSNNYEFSVEDFGTGLDHDDVTNILSKYGKSTKRSSNTELGMFGLGFKAPLAYTSSFYFTCRKNGRERKYMMYEGEETNTIDLLHETVTDKSNGVKVTIPVRWSDHYDFKNKIKEQLAYFENVYFNVDGIDNNFSIHRNKIFQFSELANDDKLHICLDDVYYPLDFQKIGIDSIDIPVGLRFGLEDGLFPTPNRESLIYSQESKKVIRDKLVEFANYMTDRYNDSITETDDIRSVLKYYTDSYRVVELFGAKMDYEPLRGFTTVKLKCPKIKGVNTIDLSIYNSSTFSNLLCEYVKSYKVENDRMYSLKHSYYSSPKWSQNDNHFIMNGVMKGHKKNWIREQAMDIINAPAVSNHTSRIYRSFILKKNRNLVLGNKNSYQMESYYEILRLENYDKSQWRDVIKDWQKIEELILSNSTDMTDAVVPAQWIADRKAIASKKGTISRAIGKKLEGEISFKKAEDLMKWSGDRNCKFVANKMKLQKIKKESYVYIYDSYDNQHKLDKLYNIIQRMDIRLISLSNRELKLVNTLDIKNLISYDEFMKGDHIHFRRISTAHQIRKLTSDFSGTFRSSGRLFMNKISSNLYKEISELEAYVSKHFYTREVNYDMLDKMVDITNAGKNLEDHKIYYLYNKIKSFLEANPFIEYMCSCPNYGTNKRGVEATTDLFKYHKIRVNIEHYKLKDMKGEEEVEVEQTEV
tara:strand:- start:1422 stop:3743 length:2322 start_codon:yes stop_codon:yes gene_type:complete